MVDLEGYRKFFWCLGVVVVGDGVDDVDVG